MPSNTHRDAAFAYIDHEREKQAQRWPLTHDVQHEIFEWVGLIATYAAAGRFIEAGALCVAAIEAGKDATLKWQPETTEVEK
jgi:hypothetical protein